MKSRIENMDWLFYYGTQQNKLSLKYRLLQFVEKHTEKGFFEYRNYRVI